MTQLDPRFEATAHSQILRGGADHPPLPPRGLVIGVAGHRRISEALCESLVQRTDAAVREIAGAARRQLGSDAGIPNPLRMISQLAAGADQFAAQSALERGMAIDAILPFDSETFDEDFDDEGRKAFRKLLAKANHVWTLCCTREESDVAYSLAGSLMLGQCDILLAIWDGTHARGRGGTAEVVEQAIRRGVPVIHVPVDEAPAFILWSGFDGIGSSLLDSASVPRRRSDGPNLEELLATIISPPSAPDQQRALELFVGERQRRTRFRPEYPLLLLLTGIRSFSRSHFRVDPYHQQVDADWQPFRAGLQEPHVALSGDFPLLQQAFGWADRLADHYAQIYRSGTVLNFLFAAFAVIAALAGILVPTAKPWLIMLELLMISSLVLNTWVGKRNEWHRRWLDYRYLAEQLRPMRSLKLLGAGSPAEAWSGRPQGASWADWYAASIWRCIGLPPSIGTTKQMRALVGIIVQHELEPQIAYHEQNAHRMEQLDHRLHLAGSTLFVTTVLVTLSGLVGYLGSFEPIKQLGTTLTVVGAVLPTFGAAIFGIRGQNDFAAAAGRSNQSAARLRRSTDRLQEEPLNLAIAVRFLQDAAAAMSADLAEWQTIYRHRKLAIPS